MKEVTMLRNRAIISLYFYMSHAMEFDKMRKEFHCISWLSTYHYGL